MQTVPSHMHKNSKKFLSIEDIVKHGCQLLPIPIKLQETTLILFTLGTRYLGDHCHRDIRVQRPQKPPSNEFKLVMLQISMKLQETTFILSILDTRYFRDRCSRDIRMQRPQKTPSSKTGLISINIYRVVNLLFIVSSKCTSKMHIVYAKIDFQKMH